MWENGDLIGKIIKLKNKIKIQLNKIKFNLKKYHIEKMVNKRYHGKISTYKQQVEQHMADSATLRRWVKVKLRNVAQFGSLEKPDSETFLSLVKTHVSNVAEVVFTCGK